MLVGILIFCGCYIVFLVAVFNMEKYLKKRMALRHREADMNQEDE